MARAGGALAFSQQEQGPGRPAPERNSIKDLVSLEEDQASDETCQANTQTAPGEAQGAPRHVPRPRALLPRGRARVKVSALSARSAAFWR